VLAKQRFRLRERDLSALGAAFVHFSAHTRMSGVNIGDRQIRKGAADAIQKQVEALGQAFPRAVLAAVQDVARRGRDRVRPKSGRVASFNKGDAGRWR